MDDPPWSHWMSVLARRADPCTYCLYIDVSMFHLCTSARLNNIFAHIICFVFSPNLNSPTVVIQFYGEQNYTKWLEKMLFILITDKSLFGGNNQQYSAWYSMLWTIFWIQYLLFRSIWRTDCNYVWQVLTKWTRFSLYLGTHDDIKPHLTSPNLMIWHK